MLNENDSSDNHEFHRTTHTRRTTGLVWECLPHLYRIYWRQTRLESESCLPCTTEPSGTWVFLKVSLFLKMASNSFDLICRELAQCQFYEELDPLHNLMNSLVPPKSGSELSVLTSENNETYLQSAAVDIVNHNTSNVDGNGRQANLKLSSLDDENGESVWLIFFGIQSWSQSCKNWITYLHGIPPHFSPSRTCPPRLFAQTMTRAEVWHSLLFLSIWPTLQVRTLVLETLDTCWKLQCLQKTKCTIAEACNSYLEPVLKAWTTKDGFCNNNLLRRFNEFIVLSQGSLLNVFNVHLLIWIISRNWRVAL